VANGRLIFERDPALRARFAALVFSMYADLQENRREVLHAYAAAGGPSDRSNRWIAPSRRDV
jgi:hypothetical protein